MIEKCSFLYMKNKPQILEFLITSVLQIIPNPWKQDTFSTGQDLFWSELSLCPVSTLASTLTDCLWFVIRSSFHIGHSAEWWFAFEPSKTTFKDKETTVKDFCVQWIFFFWCLIPVFMIFRCTWYKLFSE